MKRHRGPSGYHDEVFHDDDHVVRNLTKIFDDAAGSHRRLDPAEGLEDAQLDSGARSTSSTPMSAGMGTSWSTSASSAG